MHTRLRQIVNLGKLAPFLLVIPGLLYFCSGAGKKPSNPHQLAYEQSSTDPTLRCEKFCHQSQGNKRAATNAECLHCHQKIDLEVAQRRGYHGRAAEISDKSCAEHHLEHQGRKWPERIDTWSTDEDKLAFRNRHAELASFPLRGSHLRVACDGNSGCHRQKTPSGLPTFLSAPRGCRDCHASPHGAATPACSKCHDESAWRPMRAHADFDHNRDTRYPLKGHHKNSLIACQACHTPAGTAGSPLPANTGSAPQFRLPAAAYQDCSPCHKSQHGGTYGPRACSRCHSEERSFGPPPGFAHDQETLRPERPGFELTGPHALDCGRCHRPGTDAPPSRDCVPCHANKKAQHGDRFKQLPRCLSCHTGASWIANGFMHATTGFKLTGNHCADSLRKCRLCHRPGRNSGFENLAYLRLSRPADPSFAVNCRGCHQHAQVHMNAASTPAQRTQACIVCHERPGSTELNRCLNRPPKDDPKCETRAAFWGHPPGSPFPLAGGHAVKRMKNSCGTCHRRLPPVNDRPATTCLPCHQRDDDKQHQGKNGPDCQKCHSPLRLDFKKPELHQSRKDPKSP